MWRTSLVDAAMCGYAKGVIARRDSNRIGRLLGKSKADGMGFSLIEFKKDRRRKRLSGIVLFWGALAMLILDMLTNFPTPVRGYYAVWWLLVIALGAALWIVAKRLPLEETIEVSKYCRGELKVTDLTSELNVTLDTAERILMSLARKGYANIEDKGDTRVWVFPDVKASIIARSEQES